MKKEYITPEVLLRTVVLEGFIADSVPLVDNPDPDPEWDDQEARENGGWADGNDIWAN